MMKYILTAVVLSIAGCSGTTPPPVPEQGETDQPYNPFELVPDPGPVVPDPGPVVPDPGPVVPEPEPVVPEPEPVVPEPEPVPEVIVQPIQAPLPPVTELVVSPHTLDVQVGQQWRGMAPAHPQPYTVYTFSLDWIPQQGHTYALIIAGELAAEEILPTHTWELSYLSMLENFDTSLLPEIEFEQCSETCERVQIFPSE